MNSFINMIKSPYHIKLIYRLIKDYRCRGIISRLNNTHDISQRRSGLFFTKASSVHQILKKP